MKALPAAALTLALTVVPALLTTACGNDDTAGEPAGSTTEQVAVGEPAAPSTVAGDDTAAPETMPSGPIQFDVLVGSTSGPDRVEQVALGSDVTLSIMNPGAADEYHVHGYDIEQAAPAGSTAIINFTADMAGTFEVESHETGEVLIVLAVS